jgi:hypothetical protein
MIVKIFPASASFKGVSYNTTKIEKNKGELMKVANFGPLQALGKVRPEDYVNYLKMVSAGNKRVKEPQFHAAISAKGKSYDKQSLTAIAIDWLGLMGYSEQPYLIVFHKDTDNNHVHIVSTRIDKNGRKISSGFEHNRAIQNLNKVLALHEVHKAKQDLDKALAYRFGTKAQFMMVLEAMGYRLKEQDGKVSLIKFGRQQLDFPLTPVLEKAKNYQPDAARRLQLKAIFHKYSRLYDASLYVQQMPLSRGSVKSSAVYASAFSEHLKEIMGIQLLFHGKDGKAPYGYSILDHATGAVWKGGEIMSLTQLLEVPFAGKRMASIPQLLTDVPALKVSAEVKNYYHTLLKAAFENYPDLRQGLNDLELSLSETPKGWMLTDVPMQIIIPVDALLAPAEMRGLRESYRASNDYVYVPPVSIADDVDDQQIHGMRRKRQRKARTNAR